jgi:choline dehydrogenase-like flavoprotein
VNYYVGGNTEFYDAALLRPEDFGVITHHGGISPAWPIRYEDLEPYYTQAEHLRGARPARRGPDRGLRQRRLPPPAGGARVADPAAERRLGQMGLHPFHLPIGVDLDQDTLGRPTLHSACIRCNRSDGFPCLLKAKSDSEVICVEPASQHPNVTLMTGANVQRLETDPSGRASAAW